VTTTTLARLRSLYPAFTESERRVADTILRQGDSISHWSGRDLARTSGTTEPAVFRLAAKLGFDGFRSLKLALLHEQAAEQTRTELGIFNIPTDVNAPVPVQAQEVLRAYVDSLGRAASLIDPERLSQAAQMIRQASIVSIVGMGSSLAVADLAENILVRCGIPCRTAQDAHMQLLHALFDKPRHVVLAFSYSGDTIETVDALAVAKESGADTVAVTAFEQSPLTRHANLVLLVPATVPQQPYRVGLVDAVLPFLMLLDLLAILITATNPEDAARLRDRVERTVQRRKLRKWSGPAGSVAAPTEKSERDTEEKPH
jgi:DNA-binding MurR/RpiR family transcriptional regulator